MDAKTKDRISEKLRQIDIALDKTDSNLPSSFEEFKKLDIAKDGIYKNIEIAIQSAYDICAMIVKEEDLGIPEDEESLPDLLKEEEIISQNLADNFKDMKGFRNALAHRYGSIDDKIAYENIVSGYKDFEKFKEKVDEYLN